MITDIRTRVDSSLKESAVKILKREGLTINEYIRQALIRVAEDGSIPFQTRLPNKDSLQAIKEAQAIGRQLENKHKGVLFDE